MILILSPKHSSVPAMKKRIISVSAAPVTTVEFMGKLVFVLRAAECLKLVSGTPPSLPKRAMVSATKH